MLIVVDVWIIYWWYEGNMFADYWHGVCQVKIIIYCCFGLEKAGLLQIHPEKYYQTYIFHKIFPAIYISHRKRLLDIFFHNTYQR